MESEFFIQALGFSLICFINIKDLPSLMFTTIVTIDSDSLSLFVLGSCNIKYFTVLPIDELASLILENLEPA
jgi:hypothetical protein